MAQRSPALERRPLGNFTPPPTYAETLSTAPLTSGVRSPPSYSALYPSSDPKPSHLKGQAVPASKTGILEESMARRGSRKSMFTFVEKPKVTPNPDLLDLVQTADEKRRQRDQGEAGLEEEPFLRCFPASLCPSSRLLVGYFLTRLHPGIGPSGATGQITKSCAGGH